ncbi:MAG: metal-dependent transcriptional regulator [Armatimonadetes bacterium]|nr:metal-dependent transcriptional regulator [Armatimonadota bacterium]
MTSVTPRRRHSAVDGSPISPAMEDYVKSIYQLKHDEGRVTTQLLADHLGVAPASVTNMLKRLSECKLVEYERYKRVDLTEAGRKIAMEMIRHHRLLELYLTQALGFSWDTVHAEAERLEHYISEELEARIDEALGYPSHDPHGSPIPTLEGEVPVQESSLLSEQDLNHAVAVLRIDDEDPAVLRAAAEYGLVPGVTVEVLGRPRGGSTHLRIGPGERLVPPQLCARIRVGPV